MNCVAMNRIAMNCIALNRIAKPQSFLRLSVFLFILSLALVPGLLVPGLNAFAQSAAPATSAKVEVYFSPKGGAQDAIIRAIDAAKQSIRIQAYSYTSAPIGEALLRAHKRGVKITALLDDSNQTARYTGATFLQNAGIAVSVDARHQIAHSKIIILDSGTPQATVITGSFNFSKAAEENNTENLLVIKEAPELVKAYDANFDAHMAHGIPYVRKNVDTTLAEGTALAEGEKGEENPTTAPATVTTPATPTTTPATPAATGKININTASIKELERLPGVGPALAVRIVDYREANGPFKSVEDLNKVRGIGKATLDKLRDLVTVG